MLPLPDDYDLPLVISGDTGVAHAVPVAHMSANKRETKLHFLILSVFSTHFLFWGVKHKKRLQNYYKNLNYANKIAFRKESTKKNDPKAVFCVYRCAVGRFIAALFI